MSNRGNLLKGALLAVALVAISASGSPMEKVAPCCTAVDKNELNETVLNYWAQPAHPPCVTAVIFQTRSGLHCKFLRAPWVRETIVAFNKRKAAKAKTTSTSPLSIITSTASPSPPSSFPSYTSSSSSSLPPTSVSSTSNTPTASPLSSSSSSFLSSLVSSSTLSSSPSSSFLSSLVSSSTLSSSSSSEMPSGEDHSVSE